MAIVEFTTEELASEEWRPVVGHEGRYEVSNLGRVKSLRFRGHAGEALLRQSIVKGYPRVTIGRPERTRYIHTIVAEAFHGPRPFAASGIRIDVNHKDGIKTNCRESNLEWMTYLENAAHAARTGLYATGTSSGPSKHRERMARGDRNGSRTHPERVARGVRNASARLTEEQVARIRESLFAGCFQHNIASLFGVSQATISRIARGTHWRHVP